MRQAQEEARSANDNLEVVRDGVSKSNANTSSTLIRSTVSGLILDIPVKVGNTVILSNTFNDGTTIATVANMNDLIFRGNIDETEVGSLVTGMAMKITIGALQNEKLQAKLEYISPKSRRKQWRKSVWTQGRYHGIRSHSASFGVIVPMQKSCSLKPNHVLTVPESAIEFEGNNTYVYVIKGSGEQQTFERRRVVTGMSDGIHIWN